MFVYVYVDSYLIGMFQHESMDPKPRKLTCETIDEGVGNGDIFMPKEPGPCFTDPSTSRVFMKCVTLDTRGRIEQRKKNKHKGLVRQ